MPLKTFTNIILVLYTILIQKIEVKHQFLHSSGVLQLHNNKYSEKNQPLLFRKLSEVESNHI